MEDKESYYNRSVYSALRIGFIALLLIWSFLIIKPFILLMLWGIIIAVALYPVFEKLARKLGERKKLAATIITVVGLSILLVPSVLLIDSAVDGIKSFADKMDTGTFSIKPPSEKVADWPVIGKSVYETWMLASKNLDATIIKFRPQLKELAPKVLSGTSHLVTTLLLFVISIIIAGALFTQAKSAKKAAGSIFETLIGKQGKSFADLTIGIIRSVVQGILGIAVIQSLLGGIGMWVIGIPGAGLWAIIILFFAIMQLPPILVLGPVAIYSFTIADITPAIIFTIWSLFVSVSDAFLKPLLLGRGVDVPMLAVLLGAIGGMIMSGIIGLFVGSVVLAITYKVFEAIFVDDILDKE